MPMDSRVRSTQLARVNQCRKQVADLRAVPGPITKNTVLLLAECQTTEEFREALGRLSIRKSSEWRSLDHGPPLGIRALRLPSSGLDERPNDPSADTTVASEPPRYPGATRTPQLRRMLFDVPRFLV